MTNLVFLDLETTGLDAEDGAILEVGIVIYDPFEKEVVAEKNWVLWFNIDIADELLSVGDYVRTMHTENGLWLECAQSMLLNHSAEAEILEWLGQHFPVQVGDTKPPLCGNTVGYFDKHWLDVHMPRVNEYFHYRSLDITSFNEAAKLGLLGIPTAPKDAPHRALADCHSSIAQLEYYLDLLAWVKADD